MKAPVSFAGCFSFGSLLIAARMSVGAVLIVFAAFIGLSAVSAGRAQTPDRIAQTVDASRVEPLLNHHPLWANPANSVGLAAADLPLNQLTLVLSRSPGEEAAFKRFLAAQQNPASPDYHHWLTPDEVGQRFGLSDQDIATLVTWLQSQGLRVNYVSPSRVFIGFGGTAAEVGRAFQTEIHSYNVHGEQRISVSSDPMIPRALAPAVRAICGLYTLDEHANHGAGTARSVSPLITSGNGSHYVTPADFNAIYDVPVNLTGAGTTIGIVGWSRANPADFDNFKSLTGAAFADPIEVIPTAYGGIDPGPALTAPNTGTASALDNQLEATLDVLRAGSVAPAARLLLVVSSPNGGSDGIGADAQYLINTTPVPAQVMNISFGGCESANGPSAVAFWDSLFQSAVSEGISVFVASGDAGASGCDAYFAAPPATPGPNSPNYICSSSYATCVGGTEFADAASPSSYWSSSNFAGYQSVYGYIPEGGWNESTSTSMAASGGGVSTVIATPSWQTGTGVPSPATGRYTPDVSFSSAGHDGYFGCMQAYSGDGCVDSSGSFGFIYFYGTSAAAPGMAGVAALLDQELGGPQGNLNPGFYSLAAAAPAAFHDVTVATSAVSGCSVAIPSMCNNSAPSPTGMSGGLPGFLVGNGFDEVTGLGSLDVQQFLTSFATPLSIASLSATPSCLAFPGALLNPALNTARE